MGSWGPGEGKADFLGSGIWCFVMRERLYGESWAGPGKSSAHIAFVWDSAATRGTQRCARLLLAPLCSWYPIRRVGLRGRGLLSSNHVLAVTGSGPLSTFPTSPRPFLPCVILNEGEGRNHEGQRGDVHTSTCSWRKGEAISYCPR